MMHARTTCDDLDGTPDTRRDIVVEDAVAGARAMLKGLGMSLDHPAMANTPERLVGAYVELLTPRPFTPTTFEEDAGYRGAVIVRDIPVRSICEHHLLPFLGTARVAYVPDGRLLGLSKVARVVEHYAARPQVQERLTQQVCDWFVETLAPRGVAVALSAEHTCMTLRGVRAAGTTTATAAYAGLYEKDQQLRAEFAAPA